jgi:hypothetical protein
MFTGVLAFAPLFYTILLGNFGLILAICTLQFYLAIQNNRAAASGLWLAAASVKPQSIVLLGVLLVASRRWRAVLIAGIASALIFTTTGLLLGWRIWLDFARILLEVGQLSGKMGIEPTEMFNLRGLLASLMGEGASGVVSAISLAAFVVTVLGVAWMWQKLDRRPFGLKFALTICLGLLFSLHLYPQDCLLAVIPAVILYDHLRQKGLPHRRYATFVLSSPLIFIAFEFTIRGDWLIRIPILLLAILTLWVARTLWSERTA